MGYEIFSRKTSRVGTPMITFTSLGRISLNKAATRTLEKDAVEFVFLLWDKDNYRIGVRPTGKKDQRSYTLAYGKKGNGAGFAAKTFFDFLEYDYSETRSFPIEWNDQENMFEGTIPVEHFKDSRQRNLLTVQTPVRVKAQVK